MEQELYFHNDIRLKKLDAKGSTSLQKEQIRTLIKEKVDLLIISPLEAKPLVEEVELAHSLNIPTILLDRKVETDKYTTFIGADNYEIGYQAGTYIKNKFGTGNILEIWGLKGSSPAMERHKGFHEGIKNSKLIVSTEIHLPLENESFLIDKKPLLSKLNNIDLVFGHTDAITFNSYKIIKETQEEPKISFIGIDGLFGENLGIDLVERGILSATFLYPTGGKEAIKVARRIFDGEKVEKHLELISTKIDSTNIKLMSFQAKKISEEQKNIELQQEIIKIQDDLNYKQRNTILMMIVVSISIFILTVLLYNSLRQKNKKNQQLEELNQQILKQKLHIEQVSEEVRMLTEEKIKYFTNISHEFRTPLTLILSPLNEMLRSSSKISKFNLHLIKRNTLRLQRLINQLMYFRRLDFQQIELVVNEINLIDFVEEVMSHFHYVANSHAILFELQDNTTKGIIWADVNLLDKVIFNLLSNAFKFTPNSGKVFIDITEEEKEFHIQIKNTGPRISPDDAQQIFDRYYSKDSLGIGIGLALSKEFIQLHGGSISVDVKDKDYTTFKVKIPKGRSHFPQKTVYESQEVKVYREESDTFFEVSNPKTENKSDEEKPFVLVIEDNVDLTNYISNSINHKYNILIANTGKEGIKLATEKIPDVIICDIQLVNLSGYEIIDVLKTDIRTSHIPIIVLTASQDESFKMKAFKKGAESYLTKPFNLELLIENIDGQLFNRNLLKSYYSQLSGTDTNSDNIDLSFINKFNEIVKENLDNPELSVEQIYRTLGLSRIQLYRKVKAILGCGVHDYIIDYRIKEARKLLEDKDLSIKEIAYRTGFTSPSYFSTIFKSKMNVSPTNYRSSL